MAKTVAIKIPSDIEFRVIGNAFGLLIASAGLLGGAMVGQRSLDYWLDDIVPLIFLAWMGFRLYRNFLSMMAAYSNAPAKKTIAAPTAAEQLQPEPVVAGRIAAKTGPTPEQVVEEVARRIEAQREAAAKKNKFTN